MATLIQGRTKMESLMGSDNISGKTEAYTLENSKRGRKMEKASGRKYIMHRIATLMMENTKMIKRMASVFSNGKVAICSKDVTRMMKETDMAKCTGLMEVTTKVNGGKEFNMVWEK